MTGGEEFFIRPSNLEGALVAIESSDAMLVGGGTATALLLKNRLIEPSQLVWIGALRELSGIVEHDGGAISIGANATLRDTDRSAAVRRLAPSLATAAGGVGNPRVRSVATLAGAIVHGDPRQDVPPVLLATRAEIAAVSRRGTRWIALSDFFLGFMENALEDDEIVTEVTIPARAGWRDAYLRFTPGSEDDYPTVGVAASVLLDRSGSVSEAEIALGGVDVCAIRATEGAGVLVGSKLDYRTVRESARRAAKACQPTGDQRGSAAYKREMVEVMTARAIAKCVG